MILNKSISMWCQEYPMIKDLINTKETIWFNDNMKKVDDIYNELELRVEDIIDANERLKRFAPYIKEVFEETQESEGIIESPIKEIAKMKKYLEDEIKEEIKGKVWIKCDSHLPISGSIKARGGIYEVLKLAEDIAINSGKLNLNDDYSKLANKEFKKMFSNYSVAVGSTGNLGLSIGIMSAKLGFKATVHMSSDAREWKKEMLRSKNVEVIEYDDDYSKAVEVGRIEAQKDAKCYFIDDENSKTLFLGYAVSALRLKQQLQQNNIIVDEKHPLFIYLPCGVGGGPGGVAFGMKMIFKDNVHCFFAEPTHSPCMMLGLYTGHHDKVCVQDFGIDNKTDADGLAVGRASSFVGKIMNNLIDGCYTLSDDRMYKYLYKLAECENLYLEPSALAGMKGISVVEHSDKGNDYLSKYDLDKYMDNSNHIVWATGGSMVPKDIMKTYYEKGRKIHMDINNYR